MYRVVLVLLCFLVVTLTVMPVSFADIVGTSYVQQYYRQQCGNNDLQLAGSNGIASVSYVLGLVNTINNNATSYTETEGIATTTFLHATLDLIAQTASNCCLGGYYDTSVGKCNSCGQWLTNSTVECLDEGQYRNGKSCAVCPSGYKCPQGTNGKVSTTTITVQCLSVGEYRDNNKCLVCEAGYRCPENQNTRDNCGVGNYCIGGIANECEYSTRQCPGTNHKTSNEPVACDYAVTVTEMSAADCTAAGVYRVGASADCSECPAGYTCPMGTNGRILSILYNE